MSGAPLLTPGQVADWTQVSERTVRRAIARGDTDDRVDLRFHNVGWVTATDFIRREIAVDESEQRSRWYELNKRRTVSFIGSRPPRMGDGTAWRARVDHVIEDPAVDLGELLHRNGIDIP